MHAHAVLASQNFISVYLKILRGQLVAHPTLAPVIRYRADRFSTASPIQSAIPRNLQEQIFARSVRANPLQGITLRGMNNDSRFPVSAGFQKMGATMTLQTGEKISIHYQYNRINGKVYDLKFTNKPFDMKNPSQPIENLKNGRLR